ncbi:hypothetical protein [Embleya scabrispora]|uniref:hypothetical protein n=1 Tax=Embleya scabrispora TaxID=159449 RepID=UPI00039AAFC3|nr:hypothetical protein [Embleya scabrispora]MYS81571.1 hypothetical protein [Streptomyces sp. SID5474]
MDAHAAEEGRLLGGIGPLACAPHHRDFVLWARGVCIDGGWESLAALDRALSQGDPPLEPYGRSELSRMLRGERMANKPDFAERLCAALHRTTGEDVRGRTAEGRRLFHDATRDSHPDRYQAYLLGEQLTTMGAELTARAEQATRRERELRTRLAALEHDRDALADEPPAPGRETSDAAADTNTRLQALEAENTRLRAALDAARADLEQAHETRRGLLDLLRRAEQATTDERDLRLAAQDDAAARIAALRLEAREYADLLTPTHAAGAGAGPRSEAAFSWDDGLVDPVEGWGDAPPATPSEQPVRREETFRSSSPDDPIPYGHELNGWPRTIGYWLLVVASVCVGVAGEVVLWMPDMEGWVYPCASLALVAAIGALHFQVRIREVRWRFGPRVGEWVDALWTIAWIGSLLAGFIANPLVRLEDRLPLLW